MKKVLSLMLVLVLTLTMFCGCGKDDVNDSNPPQNEVQSELETGVKEGSQEGVNSGIFTPAVTQAPEVTEAPVESLVTAESLLKGITVNQDNGKIDLEAVIDVGIKAEEDGTKINTSIVVDALIGLEYDLYTFHAKGDIKLALMGMEMEMPMEQYAVKNDDGTITTYEYDSDADAWFYTIDDEDDYEVDLGMFAELDTSIFSDLVLDETKSDVYIVKATVDYTNVAEQYDMDLSELVGETDGVDYSKMTFDVEFEFDKASKALRTMKFVLDPSILEGINTEELGVESISLNEFSFVITFDTSGKAIEVSIPKSIIDNANDISSQYDGFYTWDEDDYYYDTDDDQDYTDSLRDSFADYDDSKFDSVNDYNIYINGVEFYLGDEVNKIIDEAGFMFAPGLTGISSENDMVYAGTTLDSLSFVHPYAPELNVYLDVANTTREAKEMKDCTIVGMRLTRYDGKMSATEFFDCFYFGDTLDDVLTELGEPTWENDSGYSWSGTWYTDDTYLYVYINEECGVCDVEYEYR